MNIKGLYRYHIVMRHRVAADRKERRMLLDAVPFRVVLSRARIVTARRRLRSALPAASGSIATRIAGADGHSVFALTISWTP